MSLAFYTRYAFRALLRDGQRTVLALLCIAFGVMSLIAMQLLSTMIHDAVVTDPRASLGGDALVFYEKRDPFTPQEIAKLDQMRTDGTLAQYSLMLDTGTRWLKPEGTGQVYFLTGMVQGVDPATFPLVGEVHLREPAGTRFSDAINGSMNAVITKDVADKLDLKVGDSFTLIDSPSGAPASLHISGIADRVPGARGDGVFFSLQTAAQLMGQGGQGAATANMASVTWGSHGSAADKVAALRSGARWQVRTTDEQAQANAQVADLFGFMLKGAGLLGLFVGGIGVANTLQVVLARRMLEIAMLKTLGYRRRDLLAMFGIETALLGLVGGIIGALVALGLALLLESLMGNLGALLLNYSVDPLVVLAGVAAGVLAAVIFGLYTIVRASSVRPSVLLRELPARLSWGARLAGFGLFLLPLAITTGISVLIMGKTIDGLAVVGGALVGLLVLTLLFGAILLATTSAPTPGLPMLKMARRNLKRRPMRSVFALIALFAGVFAIGFAGAVLLNARDRLIARQTPADGYNLTVYGKQADAQTITSQLAAQGVQSVHPSARVPVQVSTAGGATLPQLNSLDGRAPSDAQWDMSIVNGNFEGADAALVPSLSGASALPVKVGDTLLVKSASGASEMFHVSGFYEPAAATNQDERGKVPQAVIVNIDTAIRLGGAGTPVVYTGHLPQDRLPAVTAALGRALPRTSVVNQAEMNDARNRVFEGLFSFAVGLAGLALLAGAILIANTVGLAMVERRREMGILKAVGFTSGRVLSTLLIENALLGLIAGVLGMAGVGLAMIWINDQRPQAQLSLDPTLAVVMVGISVALALLSAVLVAWRPTHVRPLDVLRNE